ncbi:RNA cap guanine-N2 methyltransferase-domain-containing protein, partial [Phlyctochytrium arcticum]
WTSDQIPKYLKKYWHHRYSLFTKFDEGIMMDEEGWYSATPEALATYQARRMPCNVIVDAFCGVGGNAIQFAMTCEKVIAIDINPTRLQCAKRNAEVYGVAHKIEFILGDFLTVAADIKADAVFLSPPWGGPKYLQAEVFDIPTMLPIDCNALISASKRISPNICMYMPRNSNLKQLIALADPGSQVELEAEHLNGRLKAYTTYYGNLAGGGEGDVMDVDHNEWLSIFE